MQTIIIAHGSELPAPDDGADGEHHEDGEQDGVHPQRQHEEVHLLRTALEHDLALILDQRGEPKTVKSLIWNVICFIIAF